MYYFCLFSYAYYNTSFSLLTFRKYPTEAGERYFDSARFITSTFDTSPKMLIEVERLLKADEGVLRFYTTRAKNNIVAARGTSFRNPYLNPVPVETQA